MARPTKLTKELQAKACELLAVDGLFRREVAALVGIDEVTFSRWYHKGSAEERGIYHEFFLAVNLAEAACQQAALATIKAAATKNPKHLQWFLSRRFPHQWGRRDNVEETRAEDQTAQALSLQQLLFERLTKLVPAPEEPAAEGTPGA